MKYGPAIIEKITNAIDKGKGRVGAADEAGIDFDTFCKWYKGELPAKAKVANKNEFSDAVKKAEERFHSKGKQVAVMSIFRAMPKQWQAAAWWLERNFDEYVQRQKMTSEGELKLTIDNEHAERIASALDKVKARK